MRFSDQQHRFYVGGDRHTRTLHLCLVGGAGAAVGLETVDVIRNS
jgi:hypothetical protein